MNSDSFEVVESQTIDEIFVEAIKCAEAQGLNPKLAKLAFGILFGLPAKVGGPILANLMINIIAPKAEAEGTTFDELEYYHYGLTELIADCAVGLHLGVLKSFQVKNIIDDCWTFPYVGYSLIQYLNETGMLDTVEGDALDSLLDEVIVANEKAVQQIREGKDKAIGALVGQIMKKQKVDPGLVKDLLFKKIRGEQ